MVIDHTDKFKFVGLYFESHLQQFKCRRNIWAFLFAVFPVFSVSDINQQKFIKVLSYTLRIN